MRSFGFLAALLGVAAAAPYTHLDSSGNSGNVKRASSGFTQLDMSKPTKVVVGGKHLTGGSQQSGGPSSVQSKQYGQPVEQPLNLKLVNNIGGHVLNCYLTGTDSDGRVFFMGPDKKLVYPSASGSEEPAKVEEKIAIPMPPLGENLEMMVPVAFNSGRIYFAQGELEFFLIAKDDGSQGLVQPSLSNLQDPSRNINWGFVEMTMTTEGEIWSNISYVDFVGLIISMTLQTKDNGAQVVKGLPSNAVSTVCDELQKQSEKDNRPWSKMCIAGDDGKPIRVLSPVDFGNIDNTDGFGDYWKEYIDEMWTKYSSESLAINTQKMGKVHCKVQGEELQCDGDNRGYQKPDSKDIWGCNSGPFGIEKGDNNVHLAIVPRLCAAIQRATLGIEGGIIQSGAEADEYYTANPSSHYARIIHANEIDGKGYAFPYDDVNPDGNEDAAGLVKSTNHDVLIFYVGGAQSDATGH